MVKQRLVLQALKQMPGNWHFLVRPSKPNANTLPLDHRTRTAEPRKGSGKSVVPDFEVSVLISLSELDGGFHK